MTKAALEEKDEPHGWKLVPIEPTYEMLKAMDECSTEGYDERLYAGHAASVYMAAVNVAPSPSQQHAEDLAKLGWQYFECPACGSEGARAFSKQKAKDEPVANNWSVFNTGAEVWDKLSLADAVVELTPSRLERGWSAVCVINKDNPPLYTTPPQRKPLTDEEIEDMWQQYCKQWKTGEKIVIQFVDFARAIEAAHSIKGEA